MTTSLMSLLTLLACIAAGFAACWLARLSEVGARKHGDQERFRKAESHVIPRTGGIAIAVGFLSGIVAAYLLIPQALWAPWLPALFVVGSMFALGLLDDFQPIGAKLKLGGQLLIALIAYYQGLRVELLTSFGGESVPLHETVALVATVGWLVALPNIINLIDGIDGLAGGLGVLVAITLGIVTYGCGQIIACTISLVFAGALLGFLRFNFPPAKIYMGDSGAYLLGSVIATVSLQSSQKGSIAATFLVVLIALGLPILDTSLAIARRSFRGLPLFRGDAEHIHHQLLSRGHSTRRVVVALYAITLVLSLGGLTVFWTQGLSLPIVISSVFTGFFLITRYLGFGSNLKHFSNQVAKAAACRNSIKRSHRSGEYLLSELQHCRSPQEFWSLFDHAAERLGFVRDGHATATSQVSVQTKGNPLLTLRYPSELKGTRNWWGMADCLYPAFTAATERWDLSQKRSASKTANEAWNCSTTVVLSA